MRPAGGLAWRITSIFLGLVVTLAAADTSVGSATPSLAFGAEPDATLQRSLEAIDRTVRARFEMTEDLTAVGMLDLGTGRVAWVRPDKIFYAASVPKIAILLAWFQTHPEAATSLDPATRRELGLMIKASDNAMAAKYSRSLGLAYIQQVLGAHGFYDERHGGGIWMGKHYGQGDERRLDPVGGNSHAATVRQLLRYYLLLDRGRLVSPAASTTMKEIFASPDLPHRNDKFVRGLAGRDVQVLRKAGWWETWFHDTAIISGPGRRYVLVALTHHPKGDDYLEACATRVDDLMQTEAKQ